MTADPGALRRLVKQILKACDDAPAIQLLDGAFYCTIPTLLVEEVRAATVGEAVAPFTASAASTTAGSEHPARDVQGSTPDAVNSRVVPSGEDSGRLKFLRDKHCRPEPHLSSVCELGTKCCPIHHFALGEAVAGARPLPDLLADEQPLIDAIRLCEAEGSRWRTADLRTGEHWAQVAKELEELRIILALKRAQQTVAPLVAKALEAERVTSEIMNFKMDAAGARPPAPPAATIEAVAEQAHIAWSGWMRYLFSKATHDGTHLPDEWVERWQQQMNTPYAELREDEKESDREEARKFLLAAAPAEGAPREDAVICADSAHLFGDCQTCGLPYLASTLDPVTPEDIAWAQTSIRNQNSVAEGAPLAARSAPVMVHACSECQHVFSAKELAAEDREAWGHPCWGMKRKGVCEAHRIPSVLSAAQAPVRPGRPPECVHEWETRVSVMGDSIRCQKCGVFSPGIRVTSPAADEEPRS